MRNACLVYVDHHDIAFEFRRALPPRIGPFSQSLIVSLIIKGLNAVVNNRPRYFLPIMSNDLLQYDPIALRGMLLSCCIHWASCASPLTLLCCLGAVFLAILCKPRHILVLLLSTVYGVYVRLNLQTVGWSLFGVITHQFYLYWISGEFVGWSKISTILTW